MKKRYFFVVVQGTHNGGSVFSNLAFETKWFYPSHVQIIDLFAGQGIRNPIVTFISELTKEDYDNWTKK